MRRSVPCMLAVAVAAIASISEAQRVAVRAGTGGRWYRGPGVGVAVPYGYGGYSTTPLQGAQEGYADVVRARGEATESVSRAAINAADAQSKFIENSLQWTQTYWERKRLGESEIAADYAKKREARDKYLAQKQSGAPDRLSPGQLDPANGQIQWPLALQAETYSAARMKLEELFQVRAQTSITPELVDQVTSAADKLQGELNSRIREMPPNDFVTARKFLESLAYEARFPAT